MLVKGATDGKAVYTIYTIRDGSLASGWIYITNMAVIPLRKEI